MDIAPKTFEATASPPVQDAPPGNAGGPPPDAVLMQLLFSPLLQQCICIAAKLKIADYVAQGPLTCAELAAKTDTNADALGRVLRMLSSVRIFNINPANQVELTPMAALLRSDVLDSMYSFALMMGEAWQWQNWGELMHCVKTGETAQRKVHGMESFEYLTANPQAGAIFNDAMTSLSRGVVGPIVEAANFSGISTIVDIAGGHGTLLAGILHANPHMKGLLFDLPAVVEGARQVFEKERLTSRVELVAGDFFQQVPPGADVYILKHIIHDWEEGLCLKILRNIRSAMKDTSKVVIVEMVIPEGNEPNPAKMLDLQMLVVVGGKERTAHQYKELLEMAGLRLTSIVPTKSPFSLIEAVPM